MALTSYTDPNVNNDPVTMNLIDSGTATVPVNRPSTFTPPNGYPTASPSTDYSVATTVAKRPQVFEPPSFTVTLDPGMIVNG